MIIKQISNKEQSLTCAFGFQHITYKDIKIAFYTESINEFFIGISLSVKEYTWDIQHYGRLEAICV